MAERCESELTDAAKQIPLASASPVATVPAAMWNSPEAAPHGAANADELLGEVRALAEQAGAPGGALVSLATAPGQVDSVPALREFVIAYTRDTLAAREWPVILQAWQFAREGKARELIALDAEWTAQVAGTDFAEASFRVGRRQLNKLRPLRHERVVHRYLAAIEAGEARGWHPLVYGVMLAVFNLPLRQGLVNFAAQTLGGMVTAAERRHRLPERECQELLDNANQELPRALPPLPETALFRVQS